MGKSKLEICNNALLKIGEQTLQSLDDTSESSQLFQDVYDQALEEVLREHIWGCAKDRDSLTKLDEAPAFGYLYKYALPLDFIRLVDVFDDAGEWNPDNNWVIEGKNLLTDLDGVNVIYIKTILDTLILDSLCTAAVINKVATKMAFARTSSRVFVKALVEEYETVILPRARSIDSYENKDSMRTYSDPWLSSRSGSLQTGRINI